MSAVHLAQRFHEGSLAREVGVFRGGQALAALFCRICPIDI
jgi:hypothetical protein